MRRRLRATGRKEHIAVSLLAVVVSLLGVVVVDAGPPAAADPFGYPNPGYIADGRDHWFCYAAGFDSANQSRAAGSMGFLDDTTVMYDQYTGTCGTATDVVWVRDDALTDPYGNPARGANFCVTWAPWAVCDQYWTVVNQLEIFYNSASYSPGSGFGANFEVNMIKTIRHELGHSAGLSHSSTAPDAMRSGWVNTNLGWATYSQHHIDHVNAAY